MTSAIRRAAMTLQAAALALACSGCSFFFVKGPPDHPSNHQGIDCTSSRTAPVIDVVLGGLSTIGTIAAAARPQGPAPAPDNSGVLVVGALESGVFLLSSIYGFTATAKCERAREADIEAPEPPAASAASDGQAHAGPSDVGEKHAQEGAEPQARPGDDSRPALTPPAGGMKRPFDPAAAGAAISAALTAATPRCRTPDGPQGRGEALVSYTREGRVTNVVIAPPFADTATGGCIANALRDANVAPFDGEDVTVRKQFEVTAP
jgi:hypothetical protein